VIEAKGSLEQLGLLDHLEKLAHNPTVWLGAVIIALCVFIWWDRRHKLVDDHV